MAQSPRFGFCRRYCQDSRQRVIRQGAQTYIPGLAERRREISASTAASAHRLPYQARHRRSCRWHTIPAATGRLRRNGPRPPRASTSDWDADRPFPACAGQAGTPVEPETNRNDNISGRQFGENSLGGFFAIDRNRFGSSGLLGPIGPLWEPISSQSSSSQECIR